MTAQTGSLNGWWTQEVQTFSSFKFDSVSAVAIGSYRFQLAVAVLFIHRLSKGVFELSHIVPSIPDPPVSQPFQPAVLIHGLAHLSSMTYSPSSHLLSNSNHGEFVIAIKSDDR